MFDSSEESATDSSLSWDWAPVPRAPPFQPVRILPRRFHLQLLQRRAGAAPHLFSYVLEASFAGVLISTSEGSRIFLFLTEADWRAVATAGHRSHACARQLLGLSA